MFFAYPAIIGQITQVTYVPQFTEFTNEIDYHFDLNSPTATYTENSNRLTSWLSEINTTLRINSGTPGPTIIPNHKNSLSALSFTNSASGYVTQNTTEFIPNIHRVLEEYSIIFIFKPVNTWDTQGYQILMTANSSYPTTTATAGSVVWLNQDFSLSASITSSVSSSSTGGGLQSENPITISTPINTISTTDFNILIWTGFNVVSGGQYTNCLRVNGVPYYDARGLSTDSKRGFIYTGNTGDLNTTFRLLGPSGYSYRGYYAQATKFNKAIKPEYAEILEGYYAHVWQSPVLPNNHPYKSSPATILDVPAKVFENDRIYTYTT